MGVSLRKCEEIFRYFDTTLYHLCESEEIKNIRFDNVLKMALEIITVIHALHESFPGGPVIHRDIRAPNIAIKKRPHPKKPGITQFHAYLHDFNNAIISEYDFHTDPNHPYLCSMCFPAQNNVMMAPESLSSVPSLPRRIEILFPARVPQIDGLHITHFTDIYEFCNVLWSFFSGHANFFTPLGMMKPPVSHQLVMVTGGYRGPLPSTMPPELAHVVYNDCWAGNPYLRPSSMEMKELIEAMINKYRRRLGKRTMSQMEGMWEMQNKKIESVGRVESKFPEKKAAFEDSESESPEGGF